MTRENIDHLPEISMDLTDPAQARRFIAGFRMPQGQRVLYVTLADGSALELAKATDDQAVSCASQLYTTLYDKGVGYFEEMH